MAVEIKVPSVGESISEGTISRWLKKDGEAVRADEPLLEVETEKATTEVSAPQDGTLRISVPEGQTVAVGAVVGQIEDGTPGRRPESTARKDGTATEPAKEDVSCSSLVVSGQGTLMPVPPQRTTNNEQRTVGILSEGEILMSPSARHLAENKGVDVRQLTGTGPGGRITKEDVL